MMKATWRFVWKILLNRPLNETCSFRTTHNSAILDSPPSQDTLILSFPFKYFQRILIITSTSLYMKKAILFSLFSFIACAVFSRSIPFNDTTSATGIPEASVLLQEVMKVTGLQQNFELKEADVRNIEASISHKKRFILYNPVFIEQVNNVSKNKWATTALLAHEVGHHLNGHTIRKTGSNRKVELEADEFAGFVLHKLGATLEEAQSVMYIIAGTEDSRTHPGREARLEAIGKGWEKANGPHIYSQS
jgi:hypothetical protein